jgi:hypothetical protein
VSLTVIRIDIMRMFDPLWQCDTRSLHNINQAFLILLLKSLEACTIKDFRAISLIHVVQTLVQGPCQQARAETWQAHPPQPECVHQRSHDPQQLPVCTGISQAAICQALILSPFQSGHHESFSFRVMAVPPGIMEYIGFPAA